MKRLILVLLLTLPLSLAASAQQPLAEKPSQNSPPAAQKQDNFSGMYSFLREGEFVQIDLEEENRITGFISRFGDGDSDRDALIDQLIEKGAFDGRKLTFVTREIHGTKFDFQGTIGHGPGKQPGAEGYWVITGTLTEISTNANHKATSRSRQVTFKSFPSDEAPPQRNKN